MSRAASRTTNRSIQARVMVLVASGVLTSILVPGWVAWNALEEVQVQTVVAHERDAITAAHHVENVLQREWTKLQEIATAPLPRTAMLATPAPGTDVSPAPDSGASPSQILRSVYFRAELMERTFLTDELGRVTAAEPATAGALGQTIPDAAEVMESGRPGTSRVVTNGSGMWFHLMVPVRDWQGRVIGVAGGTVNSRGERMAAVLREHATTAGTCVQVIDAAGGVVAGTLDSDDGTAAKHHQLIASHIRDERVLSGSCRTCHGRSRPAQAVMAMAPLRPVAWAICLKTPESPALARSSALRNTLLWLGPVVMAFGLLFAYGAGQSVLRPVRILTRASERIAAGTLTEVIPDLGRDELGRLGRSLDRMRTALKASIDTVEDANASLERRVEDRTRDLRALTQQLADREEARARLLRQVITAQEDERKRLARELHDETCQTISALAMRLGSLTQREGPTAPELLDARALAVRALDELHRLIYDLRPSVLDDLGLWSAIRWYAERQLIGRGVAVRCEFADVDRRLPPLYETALFRVSQEAISNIAKHADAEQVLIQGQIRGDVLTIEIEDDGKGFDPAVARSPGPDGHGWGLLGITERVDALGGHVEIDSAPDQGVRIVVTVTLPAETPRV